MSNNNNNNNNNQRMNNRFANFAAENTNGNNKRRVMDSSDSSDDEILQKVSKVSKQKRLVSANAKFANRSRLNVKNGSDEELEVVESMFGMHEMKSSQFQRPKPAAAILQKRKKMSLSRKPGLSITAFAAPKLKKRTESKIVTSSSSSSSFSWLSANKSLSQIERDAANARAIRRTSIPKKKLNATRNPQAAKGKRKKKKNYDSPSDDDGVLSDDFVVNDEEEDRQTFQSDTESEPEMSDSMLDESSSSEDERTNRSRKKKSNSKLSSKSHSATASRFFDKKKRSNSIDRKQLGKSSRIQKKAVLAVSSDDEEDDDFFKVTPSSKNIRKNPIDLICSNSENGDDDLELEERQAIKQALKLSLKENIAPLPRIKSKVIKKMTNKKGKPMPLLSDDDEVQSNTELNGNDEEVDEFEDEEDEKSKEAGSVLRATNRLSSFIVAQMTQWCVETSENEVTGGKGIVQGMLVSNGALSAGSVAVSSSGKNVAEELKRGLSFSATPRWIERDEIEELCPGLRLADYQVVGVNWLALLYTLTYKVEETGRISHVNGVLADEMGLGKTVQTIAFLAWLRAQQMKGFRKQDIVRSKDKKNEDRRRIMLESDDEGDEEENTIKLSDECNDTSSELIEKRPHLIVVPASVLSNWMNEFKKFCPGMTVVKYHGSQAERGDIQDHLRRSLSKSSQKLPLDVVLTTFSYFSAERSDDRNFLRKFKFDYMVVDEAHCLKNPKSLRYRNMAKFSTAHRLLLTGTPVQNSAEELMALLCFVMPLFKRTQSSDDDDDGGRKMLDHFVTMSGRKASPGSETEAYGKLKQLLAPFVLRRRKVNVLSQMLPPKVKIVERVPFDATTRKVYDDILANHLNRKKMESESTAPSLLSDTAANQHIFTNLRKAANHPLLLRTRYKSKQEKDHLAYHFHLNGYFGRDETCTLDLVHKELDKFCDYDIHCAALDMIDENPHTMKELDRYCLEVDDLYTSPKLVRLRSLLPELIRDGHRILIFSQWTMCLDILGSFLESLNLSFFRLDGQTQIGSRQNLIDKFNNDNSIPIFLLSTRAGGMGINLTSADTCILHDLDFNPFNDLQAEDRCHRIGQKKEVTVIKMIIGDTVDSDIYAMQERKAQMNAAIFENEADSNNAKSKSKATEKKEEKEAITSFLQNAMDRYMKSPKSSE